MNPVVFMGKFKEVTWSKLFLIIITCISLAACGGGGSSEEDSRSSSGHGPSDGGHGETDPDDSEVNYPDFPSYPEPDRPKYFVKSDLQFVTQHSSVSQDIQLHGVIPTLSLGKTSLSLFKTIDNGWANHWLAIDVFDSDGLDGTYQCKAADSTFTTPELSERECFIRFDHDNYVGYSESWVVSDDTCTIEVEKAELGVGSIYEDVVLDIDCNEMINAHTLQDTLPAPAGSDLISTLTISGKVYATSDSGKPTPDAVLQNNTASLSISGGDGIISSDLQLEDIGGISPVPGIFFGFFEDESSEHRLTLYINAPYDVNGTFDCVDPPTHPGTSPALFVDDRECLITIEKDHPDYYGNWVWDSRDGGGCTVTVNNARFESNSYPLYEFQATINCPNMVSQAITYDYRYPNDEKPANLNIQGTINFINLL